MPTPVNCDLEKFMMNIPHTITLPPQKAIAASEDVARQNPERLTCPAQHNPASSPTSARIKPRELPDLRANQTLRAPRPLREKNSANSATSAQIKPCELPDLCANQTPRAPRPLREKKPASSQRTSSSLIPINCSRSSFAFLKAVSASRALMDIWL